MSNQWLKAVKYGVVLGTICGCISGLYHLLPFRYFDYHLYNTFFRKMALYLDSNIGVLVVVSCALMLVWSATTSLLRLSRIAFRSLAVVLILFFLAWTTGLMQVIIDPGTRVYLVSFLNENRMQLLSAVLCLALGIFLLRRIHQNQPKGRTSDPEKSRRGFVDPIGSYRYPFAAFSILAVGVNLTAGYFAGSTALTVRDKPNIIFVMFDTCRADRLSCYGYQKPTSPNIDKFASGATRFARPISQASMTSPSLGSFMSSQYPPSLLLRDMKNVPGIPQHVPTLAEVLKDRGYSTNAVISNVLAQKRFGFGKGFDYYNEELIFTDVVAPKVLSLGLDRIEDVKKPFFMFLLFMDPHTPYIKHEGNWQYPAYKGRLGPKVNIKDEVAMNAEKLVAAEDLMYAKSLYDGEVQFADHHFGKLIEQLKQKGLYDNSMIIFVGDHGEEFMEHGRLLHGYTLYDEVTNVPLVIKLPNQTKATVAGNPFPLINLFPSILRHIGIDPSPLLPQGHAVKLDGLTASPKDYVFSTQDTPFGKLWSVQDYRYKLVWNITDQTTMLFDLNKDRAEKHDVGNREPGVRSSMLEAAKAKEDQVGWGRMKLSGDRLPSPQQLSEQEKERLRSLGYLQ